LNEDTDTSCAAEPPIKRKQAGIIGMTSPFYFPEGRFTPLTMSK
jgi:hypothetical protein